MNPATETELKNTCIKLLSFFFNYSQPHLWSTCLSAEDTASENWISYLCDISKVEC